MAQTLAGHWQFDDSPGTKAVDASGNARTATLVNGASLTSGKVGGAVSATAAYQQYVSVPALKLTTAKAVTVAFWSNRTYSTAGTSALLESTVNYGQSTTGFGVFPDDNGCGGIKAALKGNVGVTANCYAQPTSGVWHHFALVMDKTKSAGNQVALYIDGSLQNPTRSAAASTNTNDFGNNPIYVFSRAGSSMFDNGRIDDLRVYSGALSASQIQQVYSGALTQISQDFAVSVDGGGVMKAPSFTTSANNEVVVAFVGYDGTSGVPQTATVSGGGLTWTLRARSNARWGTSEIWSTTVPAANSTIQVTSQPGDNGTWHGSLTVIGFLNASGIGQVGKKSASSGAPDISFSSVAAGNWVFGVGNDWDRAIARQPVTGQILPHQRVDTQIGDTYWVQSTATPSTATGTVDLHDSSPTTDQWNYAAVEIVAANGKGTLAATPASVSFGNVPVNTSSTQSVTLTNTGNSSVTVTAASISGTGFSLAPVSVPFTLSPNTSKILTATFSPTATGTVSGSIGITSDGSNPSMTISLSGTGTTTGTLTATPSSVSFGNVNVGSKSTQSVTVANTGTGTVTVSGVSISGSGYSLGTISTPFTLAAGASKQLSVSFAPTVAGVSNGSVVVTSDATNSSLAIPLSGSGVSSGSLAASPTSVNFGNVNVNGSASQAVTLTNTGSTTVTVSAVSVTGTGFSLSAVSTPFTLAAGTSKSLTATFAPKVSGAASGSISVTSDATNPNLSIPLSGTGTTLGPLTASPSSLNFGNVTVNTSSSLSVNITNSGTGTVTVSGVSISGAGYSLAAVSTPFTLAAGATKILTATFTPTITGTVSGGITINSNATNPTLTVGLTGTGVAVVQHQVALSWTASNSQVIGYNAYRATNINGPFNKLNSGLVSSTNFTDGVVSSGTTYYYYTTAVDAQGNESNSSNQVSATVP